MNNVLYLIRFDGVEGIWGVVAGWVSGCFWGCDLSWDDRRLGYSCLPPIAMRLRWMGHRQNRLGKSSLKG